MVWSGGGLPRGVSNFLGGLQFWGGLQFFGGGGVQFFGGSPIWEGGLSNFFGGCPIFRGSLILRGVSNFLGVSNFGEVSKFSGGLQFFRGGVNSNFLNSIFFSNFFPPKFLLGCTPPQIRSLSGWYASYWNAFLYLCIFLFFHRFYYDITNLLPPATKLRQGSVFTPVCHSVHRRGLPHPRADPPSLDRHPLWADTPWTDTLPPRQTPPGRHHCWADTLPLGRHPLPRQTDTPRADNPLPLGYA